MFHSNRRKEIEIESDEPLLCLTPSIDIGIGKREGGRKLLKKGDGRGEGRRS